MRILGISQTVSFQRKPTKAEEVEIKSNIDKAYAMMGTKERAVITHGSCFPAYHYNSYIGSPYGSAAKEYIKFLSLYGFNSNQLGPCGELQKGSNSPYNSSAFAGNRLFIDLEVLTRDDYGNLVSDNMLKRYLPTPAVDDKNYTMTDFNRAEKVYDIILNSAFENFKSGLIEKNPRVLRLNEQYQTFLENNEERLTEEGMFKALSAKYGTEDYTVWQDNASLISDVKKGGLKEALKFSKIYHENYDEIEQYKFEQFLLTKQIQEHKQWRDDHNFKYINDLLVGCSKMDAWRYEDAFLKDWEMGAYEWNGISQRWHVPVIDPKKIFLNDKYELNSGGKFLEEKINTALEYCENLRVDHVMGLIEPYLMAKNSEDEDFVTYPSFSKNKNLEKYISELKNEDGSEYDTYWDYPKLLEHLVLPIFKKHGLDKETVVWEDLCSSPERFLKVMQEQKIPGITCLDWVRAEDAVKTSPDNWFLLSSHDFPPVMTYLRRVATLYDGRKVEYTRKQDAWNTQYLAGYLNMDDSRENINAIRRTLSDLYNTDDKAIVRAKFTELMTTPKFQISFDDLLGIIDKVYNVPGNSNVEDNWKLRISPDFIDKYYEDLSSDSPTALNIPELLHDALQAKIDIEVKSHNYDMNYKRELYSQAQPVLDKLKYYAEVLKEKD